MYSLQDSSCPVARGCSWRLSSAACSCSWQQLAYSANTCFSGCAAGLTVCSYWRDNIHPRCETGVKKQHATCAVYWHSAITSIRTCVACESTEQFNYGWIIYSGPRGVLLKQLTVSCTLANFLSMLCSVLRCPIVSTLSSNCSAIQLVIMVCDNNKCWTHPWPILKDD